MVSVLKEIMKKHTTPINPAIGRGLSHVMSATFLDHIDATVRNQLNISSDLGYDGYKIITPEEEYEQILKSKTHDYSRSDLFKISLHFKWKGEPTNPRPLYVPYISDGGNMFISGTRQQVMPILSDSVITPEENFIFIKVNKDKNRIEQNNINFYVNGEFSNGRVIYSLLYRAKLNKEVLGKSLVPPIILYLLGSYGFRGTLDKFAKSKIEFSTKTLKELEPMFDTHYIYSTSGKKPRTLNNDTYEPHGIKIIINKKDRTSFTDILVGGLMYVFDVFPKKAEEIVDIVQDDDLSEEIKTWRFLLGTLIFKGSQSAELIDDSMNKHFRNLGPYLDSLTKDRLKERGIIVNDFIELLGYILQEFSALILNYQSISNNLENRFVDVNNYILYEIVSMINIAIFEISKKDDPTFEEVNKILNENITSKVFYRTTKGGGVNLTLALTELSGANLLTRATTLTALQEDGDGVNRAKKVSKIPPPFKKLTGSQYVVGSLYGLKKAKPIPPATLNYFLNVDLNSGKIIFSEKQKQQVEDINTLLSLDELNKNEVEIIEDDGPISI